MEHGIRNTETLNFQTLKLSINLISTPGIELDTNCLDFNLLEFSCYCVISNLDKCYNFIIKIDKVLQF